MNVAMEAVDLGGKTVEKELKQYRMRRAKLAGLARKLAEQAQELETLATESDERDRSDEGRVRSILNAITGGAIEHMLRGMNLEDADRNFLREKGWRV